MFLSHLRFFLSLSKSNEKKCPQVRILKNGITLLPLGVVGKIY